MKLDKEEQEILDAYDKGAMKLTSPSRATKQKLSLLQKKHFAKTEE